MKVSCKCAPSMAPFKAFLERDFLPISSKNERQGPGPCLGASQGSCVRPPRCRSVGWCCSSAHQGGNAPRIYRQGRRVSRREILRGERPRRRALAMAKSPPRPPPIRVDSSAIFISGLGFDQRGAIAHPGRWRYGRLHNDRTPIADDRTQQSHITIAQTSTDFS